LPLFLAFRAMSAVAHRLELTNALQSANEQLAQLNAQLEQRVRERTADLECALRTKDDFVSIVTHELRTPLTSIVGSLGVLTDTLPTTVSARTRRMLAVAYKNSERLTRLINDILDLQRFSTHSMTFQSQPVDISRLVDHAVEVNRPYAMSFDVTLTTIHGAKGWYVLGDSDRLLQVLTNFLSNACKFSPSGAHVTIATTIVEHQVRVTVTDHGLGIPESFRAHVFEKFTQADTSLRRRIGGSGLGLHIAKSIIDTCGGRIGFDTECGVGTTFFFELPSRAEPALIHTALEMAQQPASHSDRESDQ
jgi:signal transduction histidine kinase